jgi:DNA-binding SARP family transcriptional activator
VNDLPQRADAWLALAEIEGRLGNTEAALTAAEGGLTAAASPELRRRLAEFKGRTLARNGAADEARKVWQALIAEQPRDEDLREDFIDLLTEAGDNDAAIKEARELAGATTDPYRRVLRRSKAGDLLARQDSGDEAVAEFRTALLDTGSGSWLEKDLLQRIEAVFRRADRAGDLSAFVAKLAAEQPQRLNVRRWQARLLAEEGNAEAADEVWRALVQSAPGDRELTEAFIRHLTESARHAEAAAQWRVLIRLHPQEAELRLSLAAALHAAKDDAGCAAAVREFLTVSGETEEAAFRAASELGKYKLAGAELAILESNIRRFPLSEQARMQFTAALHASGKKRGRGSVARGSRPGRPEARSGSRGLRAWRTRADMGAACAVSRRFRQRCAGAAIHLRSRDDRGKVGGRFGAGPQASRPDKRPGCRRRHAGTDTPDRRRRRPDGFAAARS